MSVDIPARSSLPAELAGRACSHGFIRYSMVLSVFLFVSVWEKQAGNTKLLIKWLL